jgi:hypothetical protein
VSKSIKAMCSQTDYTDACEKSLGKAANASSSSRRPRTSSERRGGDRRRDQPGVRPRGPDP